MTSAATFTVEEDFRLIGRTFEEYRRMFALAPETLIDRRILDCAAGASSFTATANTIGATATAVDPAYGPSAADLARPLESAIVRTIDQLRDTKESFVWEFYGDVATRERYLRAAMELFLADYARRPDRYLEASLPDLPFERDEFSLVLSGNFLFLYDDRLDLEFHLDALRELARVAREEVRVFTLSSLDRTRSAYVEPVVGELRTDGIDVGIRDVPYEFQPGATEMLVLTDVDGVTDGPG